MAESFYYFAVCEDGTPALLFDRATMEPDLPELRTRFHKERNSKYSFARCSCDEHRIVQVSVVSVVDKEVRPTDLVKREVR